MLDKRGVWASWPLSHLVEDDVLIKRLSRVRFPEGLPNYLEVSMARQGIAPQEEGQLPNEKRCRQCWRLLSYLEDSYGATVRLWCSHCQIFYKEKDKEK